MTWANLSEAEQRAIVTAVRLGAGDSCTAAQARRALDWASDVRADGTAQQRARLASVLSGELVIVPRQAEAAA